MAIIVPSSDLGFAPGANIVVSTGTTTTLTESKSISMVDTISLFEYVNTAGLAIGVLTNSTSTLIDSPLPIVTGSLKITNISDVNLAQVTPVPKLTYGYTDGIPVTVSNAAAVTATQTWYMG